VTDEVEKYDSSENSIEAHHVRNAGWVTVGLMQVADIVGTGVLGLGGGLAQLGWVMGITALIAFLPLNIYAGLILGWTQQVFPKGYSYASMSAYAVKSAWFTFLVKLVFNTYILFCMSQYTQVLGESIKSIFYEIDYCNWQWGLFACVALLPIAQIRTLNQGKLLLWGNALLIMVTVLSSCGYMMANMNSDVDAEKRGPTEIFPSDLSWQSFFAAMGKFGFAYLGNFVYLEMIAEMKNPNDFPKTFFVSAPYQLVLYMIASIIQYQYQGNKAAGMINQAIPQTNPLYRIAAISLALHVMVTYLIKATIMARLVHNIVWRETINENSWRAKIQWMIISTTILLLSYIIANLVPNFDAFVSFLGTFQVPVLGFIFPPIFYYYSQRSIGKCFTCTQWLLCGGLVLIGFVLFLTGFVASIFTISDSFAQGQSPFYC